MGIRRAGDDLPDEQGEQSQESQESQEPREVAEYALLGLLREGPQHGYRLAAAFAPDGRLAIALRLKMSQMYAYLRKLERQGLLLAHDEPGESAHRTRRVFALTPAGERTFDAWLAEPVEATRDLRLAFLVKLAFTLDDPVAALALLDRQRGATASLLARLRGRDEARGLERPAHGDEGINPPAFMPPSRAPAFQGRDGVDRDGVGRDGVAGANLAHLALRRRILLTEASLAWLEETQAALGAGTAGAGTTGD
jgi:DNA-binding PadR family transcriptional regulator